MQRLAVKFSRGADRPVATPPRRGRSLVSPEFTFLRDTPGPPIRSQLNYCLLDALQHANLVAIHREDNDPVYRGEVHI